MGAAEDTLANYKESRRAFSEASGTLFTTGRKLPDNLSSLISSSFMVDPSKTEISGATFLSSIEQVKVAVPLVIQYIDTQKPSAADVQKLNQIKKQMEQAQEYAEKSQKTELTRIVEDPDRAADDFRKYYHSITDIEFSSRNLYTLATQVSKEGNIPFNKSRGLLDNIKSKISKVANVLGGIAASLEKSISGLLDQLPKILKKGLDDIVNAFLKLSDYFIEFIITLTEQMFELLTKIKTIAKSKGYAISNIEIKLPSLKFDYVTMFQVSIPLPNINPPEITISLNQTSSQSS